MTYRSFFPALAIMATTLNAVADVVPNDQSYVPLNLSLHGQEKFPDGAFIVAGCSSKNGRHYFTLAQGNEALNCGVKTPPTVHLASKTEAKVFQTLYEKDLGWASEGIEARKLLEKTKPCGTIEEQTLVPKLSGIASITAAYALDKTTAGCSLKKESSQPVMALAATSATSATAASKDTGIAALKAAATVSDDGAKSSKKSGCSVVADNSRDHSFAWFIAGALVLAVLRAKRGIRPFGVPRLS